MKDFNFNSSLLDDENNPKKRRRNGPRTKSFGYQVLGFGAGGSVPTEYYVEYLVVAGGAGCPITSFNAPGGGGGAGGYGVSPSNAKNFPVWTIYQINHDLKSFEAEKACDVYSH